MTTEWIDVKDELPPLEQLVLVYAVSRKVDPMMDKFAAVWIGMFQGNDYWIFPEMDSSEMQVLFWQPLPEGPIV